MRYVARVQRGDLPEVQYRGELGYVRAKATRKLRQHVARMSKEFPRVARYMAPHISIGQDNWGGAIRYARQLMPYEMWSGSYAVFVD